MTEVKENPGVRQEDQFDIIKIYRFAEMNPEGLFSNNIYGTDLVFRNLTELVMLMEDCMDHNAYPQPMSSYRKLHGAGEGEDASRNLLTRKELRPPQEEMPEEWKGAEPVGTFRVRIVFRTMAGWQGDAECLESGESVQFRSDMEFIMFLADQLRARTTEA